MNLNESVFDDDLKKSPVEVEPTKPTEPVPETSSTGEDELDAIRARMEAMAASMTKGVPVNVPEPEQVADVDFLGDVDAEQGVTPEQLKSGFTKLHKTLVNDVAAMMADKLSRVESNTQSYITGVMMAEKFFDANPDLRKFRAFVGMKWDQIVKDNPGIGYDQLFTKLGEVSRKELNLVKEGNGKTKPPAPALPKGRPGTERPGEKELTGLAAELNELHPFRR